jgi:hypothetical protein
LSRGHGNARSIEDLVMCLRLAIHAILLLLASTDFTIVNLALGKGSLRWCYFGHVSEHGFGYEFVSDYSVLSILMYVLAFAVGIAGFSVALQHGHRVVGSLGVVLSVIGLVSFAIEGSHWMIEHNLSWLAFSPAVMFSLVLVACFFQRPANDAHTHPTTA